MTDAVTIIVNGTEYTDFTEVSVTKSIETLAGTFMFRTTSTPNIDFPLKVNSEVQIIVENEQVINGYIEKLHIDYSASQHFIRVSGRDRTADVIDSTVGGTETSEFNMPINGLSLTQITRRLLDKFNLFNIQVIDDADTEPFKQDIVAAEYGTTLFEFLNKYAKKRQVLLTTNGQGDLVYTRAPILTFSTPLLLSKTEPSTILRGSIYFDNTRRFNQYICSSQDNPSAYLDTSKLPKNIAGSDGKATDNEVRTSRIYHFESDSSSSQGPLPGRAKWEANFRKSQAIKWTYTVQGHVAKNDNEIWKPGGLVLVVDGFASLNSYLLISSVEYRFSLTEGSRTTLRLLDKDSFTLLISKPESEKKASDTGLSQYLDLTKLAQAIKRGVV